MITRCHRKLHALLPFWSSKIHMTPPQPHIIIEKGVSKLIREHIWSSTANDSVVFLRISGAAQGSPLATARTTPPANQDALLLHTRLLDKSPCRKLEKSTAGEQTKMMTYPRRLCMALTSDAGWAEPSWWQKDKAHSLEKSCQMPRRSTAQRPGGERRTRGAIEPRLQRADLQ